MPLALQGSHHDELRRTLLLRLGVAWEAFLTGPLLRTLLLLAVLVLEFTAADLVKGRVLLSSPRYVVDPSAIEIGELPAYVPADTADELRRAVRTPARSIADPWLEASFKSALEQHPWVKRVSAVRRAFPSRVFVELDLRTPVALVDAGAWRLTVDDEGCVLEERASAAPKGLPIIRGDVKCVPRIPKLGRCFQCAAVLHGLSVLRELRAHREHPILRAATFVVVDVTQVGGKKGTEIVLELPDGPQIEWGSAVISELAPLEQTTFQKLEELAWVEERNPHFRGVARINVTSCTPYVTPAN